MAKASDLTGRSGGSTGGGGNPLRPAPSIFGTGKPGDHPKHEKGGHKASREGRPPAGPKGGSGGSGGSVRNPSVRPKV